MHWCNSILSAIGGSCELDPLVFICSGSGHLGCPWDAVDISWVHVVSYTWQMLTSGKMVVHIVCAGALSVSAVLHPLSSTGRSVLHSCTALWYSIFAVLHF